jgi:hypothetical protein
MKTEKTILSQFKEASVKPPVAPSPPKEEDFTRDQAFAMTDTELLALSRERSRLGEQIEARREELTEYTKAWKEEIARLKKAILALQEEDRVMSVSIGRGTIERSVACRRIYDYSATPPVVLEMRLDTDPPTQMGVRPMSPAELDERVGNWTGTPFETVTKTRPSYTDSEVDDIDF